MFDLISGFLGDAIDWIVEEVPWGEIFGDALLIGGAAVVANLTYDAFKKQLEENQELKRSGATHVVIKDILKKEKCTVVYYASYNAKNELLGNYSTSGKTCSELYAGQRISCK